MAGCAAACSSLDSLDMRKPDPRPSLRVAKLHEVVKMKARFNNSFAQICKPATDHLHFPFPNASLLSRLSHRLLLVQGGNWPCEERTKAVLSFQKTVVAAGRGELEDIWIIWISLLQMS